MTRFRTRSRSTGLGASSASRFSSTKVSLLGAFLGVCLLLTVMAPVNATPYPGPDDFGYQGTQIAENLRTVTGAEIVDCDDCVSAATPIGFDFSFYGTNYSTVFVSSNGFLSFTDVGDGCCSGPPIPTPDGMDGLVAGFWTDLYPGGTGAVRTETIGVAPNREFVVDFEQVWYCCQGPFVVDFQMILHENSDIELQYGQMDDRGYTGTAGIEDPSGTKGLQIVNGPSATTMVQHRGFLISSGSTPPPPPPPTTGTTYHDLNVLKAGTGTGTVTGDTHLDIDCGDDCSSRLAQWTYGVLTATPDAGSEFSSWSGPCLVREGSAPNECTVHLSGDQTFTATFTAVEPPPTPTQCADGVDNDGDGMTDFPADHGCNDASGQDEAAQEPTPVATEHARAITIVSTRHKKMDGVPHIFVRGSLRSVDGFEACHSGQEVVLQRRVNRVWRDKATSSTDTDGSFVLSHRDRAGRYRVMAHPVVLAGDSDKCLAAQSDRTAYHYH